VSGRPVVTRPSGAGAGRPAHESVDAAALAELRPDVVFTGAGRRAWDAGADITVVVLDPASVEGILHAIATVGAMTDAEDEAVGLVEILRERLADVEEVAAGRREDGHHAPRVVALDGLAPLSSAGLWVPEQVRRAGGWEVLGSDGEPSAPATWEAVAEVDPEMVLLVPHGLHLGEVARAWSTTARPAFAADIQAVRRGRVFAFDAAAYFSRPGPRVIDGIEILAEIFDPVAFVDLAPEGSWVPVL
jgi:iron complex transport system substrate-binding protein